MIDTAILSTLGAAFLFGLSFNAAPGPVWAESLRRGLTGGFGPAFAVQIGSLVGDATWAILGLLGASLLIDTPLLMSLLSLAGGALLVQMGVQGLRDALKTPESPPRPTIGQTKGALMAGAGLSLGNPQNIGTWVALVGVLPSLGLEAPTDRDLGWFFAGFMAASVLWCFLCAGIIALAHRNVSPSAQRAMTGACGLFLLAAGGLVLWDWGRSVLF